MKETSPYWGTRRIHRLLGVFEECERKGAVASAPELKTEGNGLSS